MRTKPGMKIKTTLKTCGIYAGEMLLLVAAALLLPQLVFTLQDRQQMTNTETGIRDGFDIAQMDAVYEEQMYARMANLAAMDIKTANVTAVDYEILHIEEIEGIPEEIFDQDWFYILDDMTLNSLEGILYKNPENIEDCKKYIVYGNDYREGIAMMLWYLDLHIPQTDSRVRILVDCRTGSLYAIKITAYGSQPLSEDEKKTNTATSGKELLYAMAEQIPQYVILYYEYYEADEELLRDSSLDMEVDGQRCRIDFPLFYEELSLNFYFQAEYGVGSVLDISMGVSQIENLVPEMIQN